jgi:hypothetical protein
VEPVRFWYDPGRDRILQDEVEPDDVCSLLDTLKEAYRFLDWFTNRYDVRDTSHLELYRADLPLEGSGRSHVTGASERSEEPPKQADFETFRSLRTASEDSGDPQ